MKLAPPVSFRVAQFAPVPGAGPSTATLLTLIVLRALLMAYVPHGKYSVWSGCRLWIAALIAVVSSVIPSPLAPKLVTITDPGGTSVGDITIEILPNALFSGVEESVTPTVKLNFPGTLGVPEIVAVLAAKLKPAGKLPAVALHR